MNKFKKEAARSIVLLAVLTILFMVLIGRLFFLQIVNGEKYTEKFNLRIKREITLPGTRGNIYDRNGKPLAVNKLAWSVTIEDQGSYASERERELDLNGKIYQLITLLEKHGDSMENALQIRLDKNGNYEFTADGFQLDRFKADVYGRFQIEDLTEEEQAADAEDVVAYLADKFCVYSQADKEYTEKEREAYGLPEEFQKKEVLDIVSMRYALFLQTYQKYLSVTAARDVSPETAAAVMESDLSGVDVREGSIRVYEGGEACAPVLGYTGPVSAEDLEESEEKGYTVNSIVGKSGMEEYLEDVLQDHATFDELIYKYLVLEDKILPEQICMILYDQGAADKADGDFESWQHGGISTHELVLRKIDKLEITPADLALDPCSGSAVVTDTKTGEVLACVSYPGYDNNRLAGQMDEEYYYRIYNNASLPLYNRATQQLSAPGSTFKPVTVIAGMEEGVINAGTAVVCDGVFDKVAPPLKCWHEAGHGSVSDAASALQNSCNDYLCEISYRLGMGEGGTYSDEQALDVLQEYARLFDLDKKSGIELPESSPQVTDSYAIPSAIGQGTNNFSTVQLARYATTLGNRGTSFALTLIDQIDGAENEPEIESQIDLAPEVWDTVHIGMEWYIQSTQIFNDFPITAAGKSGTAQEIKTRPDHSLFIGFAPADVPEIAAAVRITNGYEAGNAVACGREIFETYYTLKGELYEKNE